MQRAPSTCRHDTAPWEDSKVSVLMDARAGCSWLLSANLRDNSLTSPSVQGRLSGPAHLNMCSDPCEVAPDSRVAFISRSGESAGSSYVGDGHLSAPSAPVFSGCASPPVRRHVPVPSQKRTALGAGLDVGTAVEFAVAGVAGFDLDVDVVAGVVCPMTCNTAIKQKTTDAVAIRFMAGPSSGFFTDNLSADEGAGRHRPRGWSGAIPNRAEYVGKHDPTQVTIARTAHRARLLPY